MANERPTIQVFQQVDPYATMPFRLIETMITTDGCRSRICNGAWRTFKEADDERLKRIQMRQG